MLKKLLKYSLIAVLVIAALFLLKDKWLPSVAGIFKPQPVIIEETPILIKQINELAQMCTITVFDEVVADSTDIRQKSTAGSLLTDVSSFGILPNTVRKLVIIAKGKVIAGTDLKKLQQQNPGITLIPLDVKITSENVMEIIMPYDIVLDCTDNFDTKYLLNDACVLTGKPLVYGAIYQYEGQVAVWNLLNDDGSSSPNYRDLFPSVNPDQVPGCAEGGVLPTLAGIIGCIQANEVIKYFTKQGELLAGKILMFDAQTMQSRIIKLGSLTRTNITVLVKTFDEPVISVKDLKNAIDQDVYELIDVRTAEEHNSFNIGGRHVPVNEIEDNTSFVEIGKAVVMYCSSGKRSGEAVKLLRNKFPGTNIFSLKGGLKAWQEEDA